MDHCARLCHAPTVVGRARAFGSGAMINPIPDLANADCILVIGYGGITPQRVAEMVGGLFWPCPGTDHPDHADRG